MAAGLLEAFGWSPFWADAFARVSSASAFPARVIEKRSGALVLAGANGELTGVCHRSFLARAEAERLSPSLGDWVAAEPLAGEADKALVVAVLPRRTRFSRKKAGETTVEQVIVANVDVAFVVAAVGLEFNARRLERYLAAARSSGAEAVVVVNKADLKASCDEEVARAAGLLDGVPAVAASAKTGAGLGELRARLGPGRTAAFLGSSGVGKSSLINALLGSKVQQVAAVREHDERGKHTTSSGRLLQLPDNGVLVDTAGMRELQLWEAGEGVAAVFQEIDEAAAGCRFTNCRHDTEPGCAVKAGVLAGDIAPERLESWRKLQGELKQLASKQDELDAARRKRDDKIGAKALRRRVKEKRPDSPA